MVNAFFYTAFYMAKMLRRGDLVMVKQRDADLKRALIQMIEWHARSANPGLDTWHMGRNLPEWADPFAWQALQKTYAHFDAGDSWRALLDTLELFRFTVPGNRQPPGFRLPASGRTKHHPTHPAPL